jgi:hypothetical protein
MLVLEAALVGGVILWESRYVDTGDAGKVADEWAEAHRRPGETYERESCSASFDGERESEFGCPVYFEPSGRSFVVYLRATDGHKDVEIVKVARWKANQQLAPIPGE